MLAQGATTFWETYDPKEGYPERLGMYGNRYGKSLCHAWGASPVYLLGKYYLGVQPTKPGYAEWEMCPCLGDLKWMKGDVPTPHGNIHIEMTQKQLTVQATEGQGTIYFQSKGKPRVTGGTLSSLGNGRYKVLVNGSQQVVIKGHLNQQ